MIGKTWMATASVVLLTACGGGGAGGGGDAASPAGGGGDATASTGTVRMVDNAYEPASMTLDAGQQVELVNDGAAPHTFTIEGEGVDHDVPAGESATETIELEPGTYTVFCKYHREQGMEGTLTIR